MIDVSTTEEGVAPEEPTADQSAGEVDDDLVSKVDDLDVPATEAGPQGGVDNALKAGIKFE